MFGVNKHHAQFSRRSNLAGLGPENFGQWFIGRLNQSQPAAATVNEPVKMIAVFVKTGGVSGNNNIIGT
jgi:hypothetical protein